MDRPHCDYCGFQRTFLAAHNGLNLHDELCRQRDRVAPQLRICPVAANALDQHVDRGGTGHRRAGHNAHLACRNSVEVVQPDDLVWSAESLVQVVGQHRLCTVDRLF